MRKNKLKYQFYKYRHYYNIVLFVFLYSCSKFELERVTKSLDISYDSISSNLVVSSEIYDYPRDEVVLKYGYCWGIDTPTIESNKTINTVAISDIVKDTLHSLVYNKTYYCRFYLQTENKLEYGPIFKFKYSYKDFDPIIDSVKYLDDDKISVYSSLIDSGSVKHIAGGFKLSYEKDFNDEVIDVNTEFESSSNISYLESNRKIYIRRYLTFGDSSEVLGEIDSFYIPTYLLETSNSIISNKITSEITQVGLKDIDTIGHCYSFMTGTPTINDFLLPATFKTNSIFESDLSALENNITYYIRSFVYSNGRYYYGNVISYTK